MGRTFVLSTVEQVREVIRNNEKPVQELLVLLPEYRCDSETLAALVSWSNTKEDYEAQIVLINDERNSTRLLPFMISNEVYEDFASIVRSKLGVGEVTGWVIKEQVQRQTPLHLLFLPQEVEAPDFGGVTHQCHLWSLTHN